MTATVSGVSDAGSTSTFSVSLTLLDGYAFRVDFGDEGVEPLRTDEAPPLGHGAGPSPSQLLAAAVVNCLASSLLFCLRKSRVAVSTLEATVVVTLGRTDRGRLRVERLRVLLDPHVPAHDRDQLSRCRDLFEDYCVVTESVRRGIDVQVSVLASDATH